ncbi:unnamed protein product [Rotaria sordida]|uniref:Uncharacterized protein n=1 Tax=Rotaria sordida TaxID=392033 RepID=A0A820D2L5_9BILA|nr:unnamed protein product [Rotaria sordida]
MFSSFILLLGVQFFADSLSQPEDSFKNLSRQFTSKSYSIVLSKFRKRLFSSNILHNYNISMTNSFYQDKGNIYIGHYNETDHVNDTLLHFDILMAFKNNRSSYTSRVHHVCLFASSCNQSFIKDWIKWQRIAINNTIQSEAIFSQNNINDIEFKIWSLSYHNITDLCFYIITDQNENRNTYSNSIVLNVTTTTENITPDIKVNYTNSCTRYGNTYENIRQNISTHVIEFIDSIKNYHSLNSKKHAIEKISTTAVNIPLTDKLTSSSININQPISRELTTMINQNKSSSKNHWHILIFVLIIVLSIILLAIFIVCLIYWKNYRHGYRPTATS